MATFYLDPINGSDAADGTSFANRWKTITSGATAARTAPGDTIRVIKSPDPTSLGINATWTTKSSTITLASALNALVTDCETAWTASASVTCSKDTTYYRTGTGSALMNIAAGFTTGKVAYFGLGSAQDYSGYQGLTFWINARSTTLAASTLSIRLCSDTTGDTTVDTFAIPALPLIDCWTPVYVDLGAALGSSIQSIALYADADPGTILIYLDNINTVKASSGGDNLHLRSLIGKNTTNEYWWAIRSINGTDVQIDGSPYNDFGSNYRVGRGYWGTTESVTTYHRDTLVVTPGTGSWGIIQESGSSGSLITYSGGWNDTDMSTQTGDTWIDGTGGKGTMIYHNFKGYIHFDKIHGTRWDYGYYIEGSGIGEANTFGTVHAGNCRTAGIYFRGGIITSATEMVGYGGNVPMAIFAMSRLEATKLRCISAGLSGSVTTGLLQGALGKGKITTFDIVNAAWFGIAAGGSDHWENVEIGTLTVKDCGSSGINPAGTGFNNIRINSLVVESNSGYGAYLGNIIGSVYIDSITSTNNTNYGLSTDSHVGGRIVIGSLTTSGNSGGVSNANSSGYVKILKSSIAEATKISNGSYATYLRGLTTFRNYNGTSGDHRSYFGSNAGEIFSESSVRHTASGLAWRISPKHVDISILNPIILPFGTVNVNASATVTLKLWMRRTNTNLVGIFRVKGGQIAGVSADQTSSISAAADTWQEQTLTFTPTETGAVEMEIVCYASDAGTTYSLYIDDFTPSQA